MIEEVLDRLFGFQKPKYPLKTDRLSITDMSVPSTLAISLTSGSGVPLTTDLKEGDEINPGQFLAKEGDKDVLASPVKGRVIGVVKSSDIRGNARGRAILVEPEKDAKSEVLDKMDPEKASAQDLMKRMDEASVLTDSSCPRPIGEVIGEGVDTLVVLAADREPEQASMLELLREREDDVEKACDMLKKMSGAGKVILAVPENAKGVSGVDSLKISSSYPNSLESMVALQAGGGKGVKVVAVEAALTALDAVTDGKIQDTKVVTFIDSSGKAKGNYKVAIGTQLKDFLKALDVETEDGDKVIVGGTMRGFTQYALDGSIDAGVDAVTHISAENIIPYTNEPCISCGACISVCPVKLQPNLLGSYSEFGLFDRTEELDINNCIECGLCAAVCTARRPLVQFIRLAREEVEKAIIVREQKERDKASAKEQEDSSGEESGD
jgi:H+/Na+-translocating ferredoxin:NAD+ oxidoreductase subunit C